MLTLPVPAPIINRTTHEYFSLHRKHSRVDVANFDEVIKYDIEAMDDEAFCELEVLAREMGATQFLKALIAIRQDGGDTDWKVTAFSAFQKLLGEYVRTVCVDGWIWHAAADGNHYPYAVASVKFDMGDARTPRKEVHLQAAFWGVPEQYARDDVLKCQARTWTFAPGDVTNRKVPSILEAQGLWAGTEDLRADWHARMDRLDELLNNGFAQQYRVRGKVMRLGHSHSRRDLSEPIGHRVIHDTDNTMIRPVKGTVTSTTLGTWRAPREIEMPRHPLIHCFDLVTHEKLLISTDHLEDYAYDKTLGAKLILPDEHRDMLDVLTADIDALTEDVIEGKSAGNIILAKGPAGTGKTLMAEVYSELIEKPLYRIHAGTLGTDAAKISGNLAEVFQQSNRWKCAILIDEADVFLMTRGDDMARNAVTAEFLRSLEYFSGLIFMTTNRSYDIDDAVLSRCAAVISFSTPTPQNAGRIWRMQAANFGEKLADGLVEKLVATYTTASGRDIKHLMRQSIRYAQKRTGGVIDEEVVRKVAMFRGLISGTGAGTVRPPAPAVYNEKGA